MGELEGRQSSIHRRIEPGTSSSPCLWCGVSPQQFCLLGIVSVSISPTRKRAQVLWAVAGGATIKPRSLRF
jgi:hypothetical protein